ncbi:MAG: hypothetical protein E7488_03850 [Ruminococcaceae bacterium]|nr:hypothetical protein [Oscillospiraceae bacterium]
MIRRYMSVVMCLVLIFSTGSVYATWKYTSNFIEAKEHPVNVSLNLFEYPPEEILPGGDNNDEEVILGENHFAVIDLILNESDKGYGLNIKDNVVLHKYLEIQPVVFSNQKVSGGNLKFILDPQNNTHGLYYCLEKVSDTEYYAYTFSTDALSTASGTSIEIAAYRTTLLKTDRWNATVSYLGYALTKRLTDFSFDVSSDPQSIPYSIDPDTWHT